MQRSLLAAALCLAACGSDPGTNDPKGPRRAPDGAPFAALSEWKLFTDPARHELTPELMPYEVISTLYADEAEKRRALWLPPGTTITYDDEGRWAFPKGAIALKTFWFPVDARDPGAGMLLVETRLLVHEELGWRGYEYVWTEARTDAELFKPGKTVTLRRVDANGQDIEQLYNIPDQSQCQDCHGRQPDLHPLGPRTRQLDRSHDYGAGPKNQLEELADRGWLDRSPSATRTRLVDPYGSDDVTLRARSWFDTNCAHCHQEKSGLASSTGMWLDWEHTDPATGNPTHWGICKFPTSAGHAGGGLTWDVVPGSPDQSILLRRIASTDPREKMPPLLTRTADARAVELIRDWIAAMPAQSCQ